MGSQIMAYKTLTMRGLFRAPLLLLFSFLLVVADNHCPSIMEESKHVTEDFQMIVVHGIHSMTLENLRHYFDPDAPEDNGIPMINFNLTQAQAVLNSTGSYPLSNNFSSPTMDAVDQVLSHMTDNDWGIRNAPPLERLVHALHMLEVWEKAAPHYDTWKKRVNKKKRLQKALNKLCPCLKDVESNGVRDMLQQLARKMRDTRAVWRYGPCPSYPTRPGWPSRPVMPWTSWSIPIANNNMLERRNRIRPPCFELLSLQLGASFKTLGQVESMLTNPDTHTTNLTNEAEWQIWKTNLDMSTEGEKKSKQLALYIYCALHY